MSVYVRTVRKEVYQRGQIDRRRDSGERFMTRGVGRGLGEKHGGIRNGDDRAQHPAETAFRRKPFVLR